MTTSTQALVTQLVQGFPELRSLFDDHLEANGELLPHVFFGDLTPWLVNSYLASPNAGPGATWRRVLDQLEHAYEIGDTDVKELLYVSFLEILPYPPDEKGTRISEYLGQNLTADLADFR